MRILVLTAMLLCLGTTLLPGQCRLKQSDIDPVIERFNPFFTDHTWEDETKTETARLDPYRLVIIKQKACLRHHVLFSLMMEKSAVSNSERFWITEMLVMLKRVYFNDTEYLGYKKKFEQEFVRQFLSNGLNRTFTFPVEDRTFICRIENGDWGAKIKMESVKFLLKERVKQPGIAREKDDGWFKGERRSPR